MKTLCRSFLAPFGAVRQISPHQPGKRLRCVFSSRTENYCLGKHIVEIILVFVKHLEQFSDFSPPFWVVTKDGYVQSGTEQYVP